MKRLQSELNRLYSAPAGTVRAAVLQVGRPAEWAAVSKIWRGAQMDLGLPAPAIAVNGVDAYQLWFSLAEPVRVAQAAAFVAALRLRYLADIAAARVNFVAGLDRPEDIEAIAPPQQVDTDHWSAFVAPDLAPVFSDDPWLDTPPGAEGQADLLGRLDCIKPGDFQQALDRLGAAPEPSAILAASLAPRAAEDAQKALDPKQFLLSVMRDENVEMALRIEAAKALLPWTEDRS